MGWMSNWQYARVVPTERWRSAMTVPRDLNLEKIGDKYFLTSQPVAELSAIDEKKVELSNILADDDLAKKIGKLTGPARVTLSSDQIENFSITLSNNADEKVVLGYEKATNNYFVDRTNSGKVSFEKGFATRHTAPRISNKQGLDLTLIIDVASVELFADNGLSVMTEIFFPNSPFTDLNIQSPANFQIKSFQYNRLKSIWNR
jgi:fructan beta-fructosidase